MSVGIAILQKKNNSYELAFMKEFSQERQAELDVELEPGEYIILPRTSGCTLRRPQNAEKQHIKLLENGDLNPLAELCIKDIFRRLDKYMINNKLEYAEFKEFYDRIGVSLGQEDFRQKILKRFCNNQEGGINKRGFLDFWKD